jgi:taurine transport system substrate-binding protein
VYRYYFSISVQTATLTVGYQTGIDPSKAPQADGVYEKTVGEKSTGVVSGPG